MTRPILLPGLPILWRGPRTLQLGLDPRRALVVELPDPATVALLDLLDGARTEATLLAAATRRGVDEPAGRELLGVLRRHRLVVPADTLLPRGLDEPTRDRLLDEATAIALDQRVAPGEAPSDGTRPGWRGTAPPPPEAGAPDAPAGPPAPADILRRRAAARVRVVGCGRLGVPIAVALALSGVGHVDPTLDQGRRAAAATTEIARLAPGTRTAALPRRSAATFTVFVGQPPEPAVLRALSHRRLAHLPVCVRDGTALVGPLVRAGGVPCLNCLDLHRRDRDPAWPLIASQLGALPESCAATTVLAAAGYAAAEVLRHVDGGTPQTLGATVEIASPGEVRRRTWTPHPDCVCGRRRSSPGGR